MNYYLGHYQTQLRYKVACFLRRNPGFDRVRWIAKQLGENPSSVWYQLQKLKEQGLVCQPRHMYCWTAHVRRNRAVEATYLKKLDLAIEESDRDRTKETGHNLNEPLVSPPSSGAQPTPAPTPAASA